MNTARWNIAEQQNLGRGENCINGHGNGRALWGESLGTIHHPH